MQWEDYRQSDNLEDRRGGGGGEFAGLPGGRGGLGIGTMVVLGLVGWALGIDPRLLIGVTFLLPMILFYTAFVYWTFRGKVKADSGYH